MITLHKLNGDPITVNAELIQLVEALPDTVITFTDQRRLIVAEEIDEVVDAVVDYRRSITIVHDDQVHAAGA